MVARVILSETFPLFYGIYVEKVHRIKRGFWVPEIVFLSFPSRPPEQDEKDAIDADDR